MVGEREVKIFSRNFLKPLDKQSNIWYNIGSPKRATNFVYEVRL